jgi:hypothetical protein
MGALTCNCRTELEAKLTERFKANNPDASGHKVDLQGYGFGIVNNTMVMQGCMTYKAAATFPIKKGGTKYKTQTGNMIFSYCPFCGVKGST